MWGTQAAEMCPLSLEAGVLDQGVPRLVPPEDSVLGL